MKKYKIKEIWSKYLKKSGKCEEIFRHSYKYSLITQLILPGPSHWAGPTGSLSEVYLHSLPALRFSKRLAILSSLKSKKKITFIFLFFITDRAVDSTDGYKNRIRVREGGGMEREAERSVVRRRKKFTFLFRTSKIIITFSLFPPNFTPSFSLSHTHCLFHIFLHYFFIFPFLNI